MAAILDSIALDSGSSVLKEGQLCFLVFCTRMPIDLIKLFYSGTAHQGVRKASIQSAWHSLLFGGQIIARE